MAYGTFVSWETAIIGGKFVIISYYFLLFIYFLAFRYKQSRNPFHLGFGLFFLLLGFGDGFFLAYDYYQLNILWWQLGTAISWVAIFTVFLSLTYQILEKAKLWQVLLLSSPPLIVAILIAALPLLFYPIPAPPPIGYVASNYVILPIYVIVLPLLFFYIGSQVTGRLRISNFLIGGGFLVYYSGRAIQSSQVNVILNSVVPLLGDILAPVLVFFSLIFIVVGFLLQKQE
jgi:hypothetical protein